MKKLAILAVLATAAIAASATEVSVAGSRDSTQNGVSGYSVAVAQPIAAGLSVNGKFENTLGAKGTNVDAYSVGAAYDVATVGPVTLTGLGSVGYTEVQASAAKGTYVQFGAQASTAVPFVKDLSVSAAVVRQLGTSAVNALDHTEVTVGASYAVTKSIAVNASATVYDNVPGNKATIGASYSF
jgi:hypothetical protein